MKFCHGWLHLARSRCLFFFFEFKLWQWGTRSLRLNFSPWTELSWDSSVVKLASKMHSCSKGRHDTLVHYQQNICLFKSPHSGVKEGWGRRHPLRLWKPEGGGRKWGKGRMQGSRDVRKTLIAERNSHPIAYRLWVKCKCIPQQPRNKQAATSLAYN